MLPSRVGIKERPYIHVYTRVCIFLYIYTLYIYIYMRVLYELRICMCTQIREKSRSHRLFPGGALARVNKLSRFISFFHRLARTPYIYIYIFPVRLPGILRIAHTCPGNREIHPSGVSASPSQAAKYHRPRLAFGSTLGIHRA